MSIVLVVPVLPRVVKRKLWRVVCCFLVRPTGEIVLKPACILYTTGRYPIGFMQGIFTYIWLIFMVNVVKIYIPYMDPTDDGRNYAPPGMYTTL